jgi:hypothetical protein
VARRLILLVVAFAIAGCESDDPAQDAGLAVPSPELDGVGIFQASFGFRDTATTAYTGGGYLFSDGERAIGGFCISTKGFFFDYRFSRSYDNTTGSVEVHECPNAKYWTGTATGTLVNHSDLNFGPFDADGSTAGARGYADGQQYLAGLTERYLQIQDLTGYYTSPGASSGGLTFNGYSTVHASIDSSGGFTLVDYCGPGTISIASVGKNLARVTLPDCRNGKTVSGFIALDANTLHVALAVEGGNGVFSGHATRP